MSGNILIVDDDQSMAETLTTAMSRGGFVATWRTSAMEALKLLEERRDFDVVVTDLHMEGMDGFAFCEKVVANWSDVPVIMITGFGSLESAVAAIRVGAFDFITKPFDVAFLRLALARAVQHRRDERGRLHQVVRRVQDLIK
jgi:two-component system, NtrC family, response regulator AtoC